MIRVGVIGCGKIAQVRHLPEYHDHPDVRIAAVYDIDEERVQEIAQRYECRATTDMDTILTDPDIDAVSICIPNHLHARATVTALEHGKHVLCEKPMAMTIGDCEAMVEAAEKSGKYLMIGMNQRLTPTHMRAREMIRAGAIGRPLTFRTTFGHGGPETWTVERENIWFFDKQKATMGTLSDLGIHKTDLIQFLLDTRITEVTASVKTLDKRNCDGELIGVDDNAVCIYGMENGIVGTMTASWTYYAAEDNSTVIYGTDGEIRLYDNAENSLVLRKRDGTCICENADAIQTNDNQTRSGVVDAFIAGIDDPQQRQMTGREALNAMRAVFAAVASQEQGRRIMID